MKTTENGVDGKKTGHSMICSIDGKRVVSYN